MVRFGRGTNGIIKKIGPFWEEGDGSSAALTIKERLQGVLTCGLKFCHSYWPLSSLASPAPGWVPIRVGLGLAREFLSPNFSPAPTVSDFIFFLILQSTIRVHRARRVFCIEESQKPWDPFTPSTFLSSKWKPTSLNLMIPCLRHR